MTRYNDDVLHGPAPKLGDRIYLDFGDSINTGGELTGTVTDLGDDFVEVDGARVDASAPIHVEVLN